jgi:CheY-like chemotaxis protein
MVQQPKGPRILLVDDLAIHRRLLHLRLGPEVGEIAVAGSAAEAEAFLAEHHPLLLLLDVVMPGKDGFALCSQVKADRATQDIAVLMLTDLKGDAFQRSLDAGADDYLPQRVDDPVLRIRVHLHLQLQELRLKAGSRSIRPVPASILLGSPSPTLAAQLPAQFAAEGHRTRLLARLEDLPGECRPEDRLVILDTAMDPQGIPETLKRLRTDPTTAGLPVLLLCE